MNPSSTLRVRRAIALVFTLWAVASIVLSLAVFGESAAQQLHFPFSDARLGTVSVVEATSPRAAEVLSPGDRLLTVDGIPYQEVLHHRDEHLEPGLANRYLVANSEGVEREVELYPEPIAWAVTPLLKLAKVGLILVALIYLVTGGAAFYLKPDRSDSWALLLFCCAMCVTLTTVLYTDLTPWGWERLAINTPLVSATIFHLFTSYPIEPDWIVRRRRIQWIPYGIAAGLAFLTFAERPPCRRAGPGDARRR